MLMRWMTEADAEAVSTLITRSYDRVLVHYHSPEMRARFRGHATPESLAEQLGRKEVFGVEDEAARIVATGGLGWFDDPGVAREEQAGVHETTPDRDPGGQLAGAGGLTTPPRTSVHDPSKARPGLTRPTG